MLCCRIVNGIKNKNIKNSLGATWNASHLAEGLCDFASLETSFHATNLAWEGGVGDVACLIQASA